MIKSIVWSDLVWFLISKLCIIDADDLQNALEQYQWMIQHKIQLIMIICVVYIIHNGH